MLILILFLKILAVNAVFFGCLKSHVYQEEGSRVQGNIMSNYQRARNPPYFKGIMFQCQKADVPEGNYNFSKPWTVFLIRYFDGNYTAYIRTIDKTKKITKISEFKSIFNIRRDNTTGDVPNDLLYYDYFSDVGNKNFSLKILFGNHFNNSGNYYNAIFHDLSRSTNPNHRQTLKCSNRFQVAKVPPVVDEKLKFYRLVTDSKTGEQKLSTQDITVDFNTTIKMPKGENYEAILSLTQFLPGKEPAKNAPLFNSNDEFVGFILDYKPESLISTTIVSIFDRKLSDSMYKDLLIWGESPKEIPPVKHGISRRFTNVICDYLAKGLTPPGMFEYAPNWEKEWEKMQKSSAINGGSSCPTDSKSDSKKAEVY